MASIARTSYGFSVESNSLEAPQIIGSLLGVLVAKGIVTIDELEQMFAQL